MGYYTTFVLSWDKHQTTENDVTDEKIVEAFGKLPYWEGVDFDTYDSEIYIGEAKWYDSHDDMYALSKQFPTVLFHLWGNGDDAEDLWTEHWQNGKYQACVAEIPPYEPGKMRDYHP